MDWRTNKGLTLLQQAYSGGYVAQRGVLTVGGWTCQGVELDRRDPLSSWIAPEGYPGSRQQNLWFAGGDDGEGVSAEVVCGRLLPDPSDFVTYTALLAEFAQVERGDRLLKNPTGYAWTTEVDPNDKNVYWILYVYNKHFKQHGYPYDVDCEDAAEALIRARIMLEKRK